MKIETNKNPSTNDLMNEYFKNFEIIYLVSKYRKKFLAYLFISFFIGIIISLIIPNTFRSTTKIFPPQQGQSVTSAMLSQLGGAAGGAAAALGIKNPNDLYISILKSRTLTEKIINKYELNSHYDSKLMETTKKILDSKTNITSGKDNLITIEVDDSNPTLAMNIANSYVDELSSLTAKFALTESSQRRLFFEKQLEYAKIKMTDAENLLSENITTHGITSVDSQSKTTIETIAKLHATITTKQIILNSLEQFVTPKNIEYKRLNQEIMEIQKELTKLETGSIDDNRLNNNEIKKLNNKSNFSKNTAQLIRDVKYYQALYENLVKQHEMARLDEARDAPLIQVLDRAVLPEKKIKPQRTIIVLLATLTGIFFAFLIAFISEEIIKIKNKEK